MREEGGPPAGGFACTEPPMGSPPPLQRELAFHVLALLLIIIIRAFGTASPPQLIVRLPGHRDKFAEIMRMVDQEFHQFLVILGVPVLIGKDCRC